AGEARVADRVDVPGDDPVARLEPGRHRVVQARGAPVPEEARHVLRAEGAGLQGGAGGRRSGGARAAGARAGLAGARVGFAWRLPVGLAGGPPGRLARLPVPLAARAPVELGARQEAVALEEELEPVEPVLVVAGRQVLGRGHLLPG